ncbi:sensor histidine kinase [Heyndrickxia sp. NPDC080065]|uniref:sensor histidine kinase n=1 Tax=Heyndrickxia sp. NPDC080065 TaxID=3390568 RepID=UPI003CFE8E7A
MEFWVIFNKLALMVFIAITCVRADITNLSWVVFSILLYFCLNITIYIFKNLNIKRILLLFSISLLILSYSVVHPLFIILLPMSLIEFTSGFIDKRWMILVISSLPIFYINESLQPIYGLVTIISFTIYTLTSMYINQMLKNEKQIDAMRKAIQKLTKSLNENNEYIRQSEYTFKLEERNRISQEIHDKIGHSMTGALIQMEAAKRLMNIDKDKATELLQNAINISKDGIENIRLTLKNMKPPTAQVGIHRMKLFIDEFSAKHDLKTALTHEGNLDIISPIQWKIIHENVTEALTNSMKYSDASHISVDLKVLNKLIRVEVKDNGKGAEIIKKGLGIIGMEERTASINGKIIVDSTHGFSVTTLLPIQ